MGISQFDFLFSRTVRINCTINIFYYKAIEEKKSVQFLTIMMHILYSGFCNVTDNLCVCVSPKLVVGVFSSFCFAVLKTYVQTL